MASDLKRELDEPEENQEPKKRVKIDSGDKKEDVHVVLNKAEDSTDKKEDEKKVVEEKKEDVKKEDEVEKKEETKTTTTGGISIFGGLFSNSTVSFSSAFSNSGSTSVFGDTSSSPFANAFNLNSTSTFSSFSKASNEEEGENTSLQEDFSKQFTPIIQVSQPVSIITGEEDEKTLCSARGKLYILTDSYKEKGNGLVKINKDKEGRSRIFMIADGTKRSMLNINIFSKMIVECPSEKSLRFIGIDDNKPTTFLIKMNKVDEIKTFETQMKKEIESSSHIENNTNTNNNNNGTPKKEQSSNNNDNNNNNGTPKKEQNSVTEKTTDT